MKKASISDRLATGEDTTPVFATVRVLSGSGGITSRRDSPQYAAFLTSHQKKDKKNAK
jgi:hypothetical protein